MLGPRIVTYLPSPPSRSRAHSRLWPSRHAVSCACLFVCALSALRQSAACDDGDLLECSSTRAKAHAQQTPGSGGCKTSAGGTPSSGAVPRRRRRRAANTSSCRTCGTAARPRPAGRRRRCARRPRPRPGAAARRRARPSRSRSSATSARMDRSKASAPKAVSCGVHAERSVLDAVQSGSAFTCRARDWAAQVCSARVLGSRVAR